MSLSLLCFIEISVFNANSEEPDQTPRSTASDLGLPCLPMSLLSDTKHEWVKQEFTKMKQKFMKMKMTNIKQLNGSNESINEHLPRQPCFSRFTGDLD